MAIFRLLVPMLVVLTIIYVGLSFYSRSVRKSKLEAYWDERELTGDREDFIRRGLEEYNGSLRRKLILGVYVVPFIVIGCIIYFINYT